MNPQWLGMMAAFCTTFAFVPQVVKVVRDRDTRGISLGMYSIFCVGVALWLSYGLMIRDLPIIVANVITLALASCVLIISWRQRRAAQNGQ
ncbi:MAG: SemiSWEET transporter [Alcanivoracaceae bacterium]